MSRTLSEIGIKVKLDDDGWRVYTSHNGNGWWAVGVPFSSAMGAAAVARVIEDEAIRQGDRVIV